MCLISFTNFLIPGGRVRPQRHASHHSARHRRGQGRQWPGPLQHCAAAPPEGGEVLRQPGDGGDHHQ